MTNESFVLDENMSHDYDLIIIGASGGIGQHIVKKYRKTNKIFGTYCRHASTNLEEGPQYYYVDLTDTVTIKEFIDCISEQVRKPVLIYSSGISPNNPVHKVTDDDLSQTIAINLTGAILVTRAILPIMRERNFGRLIYISSVLSRIAVHGTSIYAATKSGLNAFSKVVALENAKYGITANSIALGYFDVGIISAVPTDYLNNTVIPNIPQRRLGNPVNILHMIECMIKSNYLTGSTIDITGGL
jgi:NAD(P)-dependent dehydrogenase (short-subunit alcohol dehydrogenase family)